MPIEIRKGVATTITGTGIPYFRMAMILSGMQFELKTGMKLTGKAPSCFTIARREFGLKGNKEKLIEQFAKLVDEASRFVERIEVE